MQNSTALAPFLRITTDADLARVSYLNRYEGGTRRMYEVDLAIFFAWCEVNSLEPLWVKRVHLEAFSAHLRDDRGNQPVSVARRLSTLRGFFHIALADELIEKNPMQFVKMPKVFYDHDKHDSLNRQELAAIKAVARSSSARDEALVVLMGDLGLRVSEACSINIEDIHHVRQDHNVVRFIGKTGKPSTTPLPVPVKRVLLAAAGDRTEGPLLLRRDGQRLDRRTAYRWIQKFTKLAGVEKDITPHSFRRTAITLLLDAGGSLRETQYFARHADPRMTMRYDQGKKNLDQHGAYRLAQYLAS